MQELVGWAGFAVGQAVAWPQVVRALRTSTCSLSLLSYGLLFVSMSLWLLHGVGIGDAVTIASVALGAVPNAIVAAVAIRDRRAGPVARGRGLNTRRADPKQARSRPTDAGARRSASRYHERVDRNAPLRPADHGVRVQRLEVFAQLVREPRQADDRAGERTHVRGR